jgi:lipopolysaccharide biosynthesis glycosyltransferase
VGGDADYAQLLRYSINTVRAFPENDAYDIMVMCDQDYAHNLSDMKQVKLHITPKNHSHIQSSMRKIEIFSYANIHTYEKVLYLDADTVITGSLAPLFDAVTRDNTLYVVPERSADHTSPYYHCGDTPYDKHNLEAFRVYQIFPFNAGQFCFKSSPSMRAHFDRVLEHMKSYNPTFHFYEQSFMNNHFNRLRNIDYALERYVQLFACDELDFENGKVVHHFCNASIPYTYKLQCMKECHDYFWKRNARRYTMELDTRGMISQMVQLRPHPCIAEIGTFKGDFAEVLLRTLQPGTLHLIDPWMGTIISGDQDGNNVGAVHGEQLYQYVQARFANDAQVHIHRAFSHDMMITPGHLDLIYIDGDHSYEGVKRDLMLSQKWVRPGGYICGHDYAMNHAKAHHHYEFGVKRAVDEFCKEYGYRIWGFLNDGCVSFVIRV